MYQQIDFTKLKIGNYNRKSSEAEDKQVLSIGSQKDEAKRISDFYKLPKFVEVFEESKSAKKEYLRPQFTNMIKMIENGKLDSIVCWKLDRLARNMTEGGRIIDLISAGVIKAIITHDKVYYPWDNVLLMAVEFGQGKQFVKDLSVNVKRGLQKKASMGIPSGVAFLGFINDKTEEKGNRKWLVDDLRLKKISILFEMFLTGTYSAGKLYKYAIKELKLTTVKRKRIGGALITLSRIYEILKDPIYAGFFFQGGERYELDKSLPRLITEDQHNRVKAILANKNIPKAQHNEATFAGFLQSNKGDFVGQDVKYQVICDCKNKFSYLNKTHCPKCDKEIVQLEHPNYLKFTYYYNVKRKKNYLGYKSISEEKIMEKLLPFVDENLNFSQDLVDWSKKFITELRDKEVNDNIFIQQNAKSDKTEFEAKKTRLREMLRDTQITDEEYKSDLESLKKQYEDTDKKKGVIDWYARMNEIADMTLLIKKTFENGTMQAKRNLLAKLSSNLVWDEKNLSIYNAKEVNTLVEGIKGMRAEFPEFEPKKFTLSQAQKTEYKSIFSVVNKNLEPKQKTSESIISKGSLSTELVKNSLKLLEDRNELRTSEKSSVNAQHGDFDSIFSTLLRG
ncbi:MAG: Resolvase domain protein [Parcubacteria group bacterium GW2011_GWF1_40_6]|uniref:Resolvase domain protein n=2 Tax=Candidatus Nomuraibacteriota TaxID=1752729 RepID=A0A0G0QSI3_9BACT|nr:MAG: Resolvase domain protein [Candidatus Nomurabacteria bacterium GW2011_GWF2_40_12]KKR69836.1 MAG: Resolvase domain protein [Parcubacteria group bacterium GW2011_GWF1_40_6]OGJ09439.1 MAG: hypothetical protein A2356_01150 [Candidatus Nomurabacteria bacterium RIFOXYB1_FULL_39_16]OGJ14800.1 MAG: hypothetical protein A2585_03985 [Candidatus Nomurabacteria bacterium RIFOXYD1_FULL_39_12]